MSDLYAKTIRTVFFPLGLALLGGTRFYRHYKTLERNQWLSFEELKSLQNAKLRALLVSAERSPYYRTLFREIGIVPTDIRADTLARLPVLTKRIVQQRREDLLCEGHLTRGLISNASGGSTGEPTIFYQDKERNWRRAMDQLRHDTWAGWQLGEPVALLWGAQHDLTFYNQLAGKIQNALFYRRTPLDAFNMNEEVMRRYFSILLRKKPSIIQAYASAIGMFAEFVRREQFDGRALHLQGIVSSAEKLLPQQRSIIEEVFGCKTFDRYGSREVGIVASECNRFEGMHINADNIIVEVVRDDGTPCEAQESGRIIVTDLHNYVFPFIRYDTGDIGKLLEHQCSCGRGLPLMAQVEGRTADFIVLRDGRNIHGEYFTHLLYGVQGIAQFQFVQHDYDHFELLLVKTGGIDVSAIQKIQAEILAYLKDPAAQLSVRFVSAIPVLRSGKRRFTVSHVAGK